MSEQHDPNERNPRSLGLVEVPNNTYEHDLAVSNKYQNFSSEVLRLSLLGIAAIGFLVTNTVFKNSAPPHQTGPLGALLPKEFKYLITLSLAWLGMSAGCALLHSYFSADTVAWHLSVIRRELRKADEDDVAVVRERKKRKRYLTWEFRFKVAAGVFLWLGAIFLATSFIALL